VRFLAIVTVRVFAVCETMAHNERFVQDIRNLRRFVDGSPESELTRTQRQNKKLVEDNTKLSLELTDLKVQFADLIQIVQCLKITNYSQSFERIAEQACMLSNTLSDLQRDKAILVRAHRKRLAVTSPQHREDHDARSPGSPKELIGKIEELSKSMHAELLEGSTAHYPPTKVRSISRTRGESSRVRSDSIVHDILIDPVETNTLTKSRRIIKRVLSRLLQRNTQIAFFHWRTLTALALQETTWRASVDADHDTRVSQSLAWQRRAARRVILRMLGKKQSRAFFKWSVVTNVDRHNKDVEIQALRNGLRQNLIKRSLFKLVNAPLFKAWRTWLSSVLIQRCMETIFSNQHKGTLGLRYFRRWKHFIVGRKQSQRMVGRVMARMKHQKLSVGFRTWHAFSRETAIAAKLGGMKQRAAASLSKQQELMAVKSREFDVQRHTMQANTEALEEENRKLREAIQHREDVLKEMEKAIRKAQKKLKLSAEFKDALEKQRKSVAQTAKKLDLLSEENSQLHAVNEDLRALVTTLRVKKSSLQKELAARRDMANNYMATADSYRRENEEIKIALDSSQGMYAAVKQKLLRALKLLELQKKDVQKATLVAELKKDVRDKTFNIAHQGEQILQLQQRLAQQRNVIRQLREDRTEARRDAERESARAESAANIAIEAAAANAESRTSPPRSRSSYRHRRSSPPPPRTPESLSRGRLEFS
jgi:hypothetical protein